MTGPESTFLAVVDDQAGLAQQEVDAIADALDRLRQATHGYTSGLVTIDSVADAIEMVEGDLSDLGRRVDALIRTIRLGER